MARKRRRHRSHPFVSPAVIACLLSVGCGGDEDSVCVEPIEAQVLAERVVIELGGSRLEAELADEPVEAERGWRHRRCDLSALWIPFDSPRTVVVTMCQVEVALDLAFVRDGAIVGVELAAPPCEGPCHACPGYGSGGEIDAVLEVPAGSAQLEIGERVGVTR